ncbi:MAG TPA: poly(R)-hydroxyalkanoic acid synthase subunit PhaE, partial [Thermodesulfobacteriota bacterium]|nr:poly(R)-hydroxyalkanoic acid synthase subunit PhaE [Thermodesulfobacteriota bacterium]
SEPRVEEVTDSAQNAWKAFWSILGNPILPEPFSGGQPFLPETLLKMFQTSFDAYLDLQRQWLDRMNKSDETTESPEAGDRAGNPVGCWLETYQKEFSPLFSLPQLGLARFYQEHLAQALDQFNRYQATLKDFHQVLYRPFETSNQVMQEKLTFLTQEGKGPDDFQEFYRLWLQTLEGHYLALFRSPEFSRMLTDALNSMENFMEARQAVLLDVLKLLPVPTHKDMEGLYRDLYLLKKKVRELENRLGEEPIGTKKRKSPEKRSLNQRENSE